MRVLVTVKNNKNLTSFELSSCVRVVGAFWKNRLWKTTQLFYTLFRPRLLRQQNLIMHSSNYRGFATPVNMATATASESDV